MTDKEIIQALRCCEKEVCADGGLCPLFSDADCIVHLGEAAIDLIERLTAENAKAEAERDALQEKQRWIPVTERMPNTIPCNAGTEYSEAVIVWTTGNRVLRCKDCKYGSYDSKQNGAMVCLRTNDGFWRKETDFCNYGERREE